jgi:hypothetical protein
MDINWFLPGVNLLTILENIYIYCVSQGPTYSALLFSLFSLGALLTRAKFLLRGSV